MTSNGSRAERRAIDHDEEKYSPDQQRDAAYHCGIGWPLRAAYQRDFNMQEKGKCKTKYPTIGFLTGETQTDPINTVTPPVAKFSKSAIVARPSSEPSDCSICACVAK